MGVASSRSAIGPNRENTLVFFSFIMTSSKELKAVKDLSLKHRIFKFNKSISFRRKLCEFWSPGPLPPGCKGVAAERGNKQRTL